MPTKARYLEFEARPDLEFECFLAGELGKTLDEIRQMPNADFLALAMYYTRKAQREQLEHMRSAR